MKLEIAVGDQALLDAALKQIQSKAAVDEAEALKNLAQILCVFSKIVLTTGACASNEQKAFARHITKTIAPANQDDNTALNKAFEALYNDSRIPEIANEILLICLKMLALSAETSADLATFIATKGGELKAEHFIRAAPSVEPEKPLAVLLADLMMPEAVDEAQAVYPE